MATNNIAEVLERNGLTADDIAVSTPSRKPTRGPGRPVTTGSDSTAPVAYRVSAAQRAELEAEAKRLGLASANEAAKRRAFPGAV